MKPKTPDQRPIGLREQKKQRTRLAISRVATALFIGRGFDRVTMAEVAAAADVSVNTVFNYFTTKEDLFFDRADEVEDAPSRMVRERRPGESALSGLRRGLRELLSPPPAGAPPRDMRPFFATVEASPALRARARLILEQAEARLAQTLIDETGARAGDPTARAAAAVVMGVLSLLTREFQTHVLAGDPLVALQPALERLAERSFQLLQPALGDYAIRPPAVATPGGRGRKVRHGRGRS